jgi:hypothetical protein
MRGDDNQQEGMFSYVSPEKRVPTDHPLRPIRKMVDEILKETSPQFVKLYSDVGRPSIAPERLFRSLLLQIFYSVRSERMLTEQLRYNLLPAMDRMFHPVPRNSGQVPSAGIASAFFALTSGTIYVTVQHVRDSRIFGRGGTKPLRQMVRGFRRTRRC